MTGPSHPGGVSGQQPAEPQHSSRRIAHVGMPLSKRDLLLSGGQNDKVTILIAVGLGALQARGAILLTYKGRDHVTGLGAFG